MKLLKKTVFAIKIRGSFVVLRQLAANFTLKATPFFLLETAGYKLYIFLLIGYWPNIKDPVSFNEKILHRRKFKDNSLASIIADKWAVRQYLETLGYESILNEVLFVTENPREIEFDSLPEKFVIKANYASRLNIIVTNKSNIDWDKTIAQCNEFVYNQDKILERNPEIHYRKIKPKIIVEKFIEDDGDGLNDYKFWCFNGHVEFVVAQKIMNGIRVSFAYDREWNKLPFSVSNKCISYSSINKPDCLEEMVSIAQKLSKDFDFIRVDLYCAEKRVVFGELTYNPSGGAAIFFPKHYDKTMGEKLILKNK